MSLKKGLVLDYKILLQAVLPGQVLPLLEKYESTVDFRSPDVCFLTVRRTLTQTLERKGANTTEARDALARLEQIVGPIDVALYETVGPHARMRVTGGDPTQWPVVAVALLFDSPIWTHDEEFLGAGIASWRTTTVELYLK
jgi:predicted nucleic acid-binding protein